MPAWQQPCGLLLCLASGYILSVKYFSDCHFHTLSLSDPDFPALLSSLSGPSGKLLDKLTSDYLLTPELFKEDNLQKTLENTLNAICRPVGESLLLMEEDLKGSYGGKSFIQHGRFRLRDMEFDKILLVPLVLDFTACPGREQRTYYPAYSKDRLTISAQAALEGIHHYYSQAPDGLFEFYPFLGLNTRAHSMEALQDFLDKHINTSHEMHPDHTVPDKPFYGIKLYPPLGFHPWPEDKEEREKCCYLYEFCSYYQIPMITHTDDQGFRGVGLEEAWAATSPETWKKALEHYPGLIIDFAHFGKQYALRSKSGAESLARRYRGLPDSPWLYSILALMDEYPGVYADLSFSGAERSFYQELYALLMEKESPVITRILFGTDFPVSLLKCSSYSSCFSVWEDSPFSDGEIEEIAGANALRFLGFADR